jgi:hypothetical protein
VTRDQAEDDLVSKGVPEDTAVRILDCLGEFGVYEVRIKPSPAFEVYYHVSCITQHEYEVTRG